MYPRHIAPFLPDSLSDTPVVLNAARSDPAGFINGFQGAVTLDEVQRAPELFWAIKAPMTPSPDEQVECAKLVAPNA